MLAKLSFFSVNAKARSVTLVTTEKALEDYNTNHPTDNLSVVGSLLLSVNR
jgi:hypothetical protein